MHSCQQRLEIRSYAMELLVLCAWCAEQDCRICVKVVTDCQQLQYRKASCCLYSYTQQPYAVQKPAKIVTTSWQSHVLMDGDLRVMVLGMCHHGTLVPLVPFGPQCTSCLVTISQQIHNKDKLQQMRLEKDDYEMHMSWSDNTCPP